jgi:RNA-directed DNA polymerase
VGADDADVMYLLKVMLKASGKKGVPQGGVISPLLSNLYLNEVDKMLERAREVTRNGKYTYIEYARFADDLVILIDAYKRLCRRRATMSVHRGSAEVVG